LIGRYPTSNSGVDFYAAELYNSPSTKKVGGVDQNIPAQNGANFQALYTQGGVAIDKVGLIVNDNNPITLPEVSGWTSLTVSGTSTDPDFIYHLTGENDQGIQPLLDDIRNSPQPDGIVVSSDPYLREVGNAGFDAQLRRAGTGGNFAGWVCYPFKEYVLSGANSIYSASTPVLATDVPTDTTTAYYQLGLKADDALHQRPPMLTQWTGSAWASVAFP
jgi:hypothetical protein